VAAPDEMNVVADEASNVVPLPLAEAGTVTAPRRTREAAQ